MSCFFIIMCNYFKRLTRDMKEMLILIIIPIGLTVLWSMFGDPVTMEGYNVTASFNMPALMLSFQFFNMGIMLHFLYHDFRGNLRWRLRAAPHSLLSFVLPAFVANWIFSILLGIIIVVVSVVLLNAYLSNILVFAAVLLLVSLMATFLSMLVFLFTQTYRAANGLVYIISFGLMILSGFMIPLGNNPVARFLNTYGTPLSLGQRAVMYSGALNDLVYGGGMPQALGNIGILAIITLVLAFVTIIAARRRKI